MLKMETVPYSCCPIKNNGNNIDMYGFWNSNGNMFDDEEQEQQEEEAGTQNVLNPNATFPVKIESATESQVDSEYGNFSKSFSMESKSVMQNSSFNNNTSLHYSKDCVYHREKTELSDVLFSFKATPQMGLTVYPGQMSPVSYAANSYPQPSQLFQQNGYSPNYCLDQSFGQSSASAVGTSNGPNFSPPFPAMSVNVSMNMTMGYLPPPPPPPEGAGLQHHHHHHHHQMQWTSNQATTNHPSPTSPPTSSTYPAYGNTGGTSIQAAQNLCGQPYNTTYSFAADFRSDPPFDAAVRSHWLPSTSLLATAAASNGVVNAVSKAHHHHFSVSAGNGVSKHSVHHSYRTRSSAASDSLSPLTCKDLALSKQNLCRICGKTYARPSTLKTHLRTHSGEKPYRCNECYKSFSQAANLTAHVRTHSGEKPFHCTVCDRKFSQSSSVTTHMRTHSGEKPYRCRLCKKAFSDSSTLTKHLRIHSGEKPYQCKLCLLRFSQSGNLNRHMRVHATSNSSNGVSGGSGSGSNNPHHC